MVGATVSHYRLIEKLGAGGMGVVWKAEDTRLGRTVALKFLQERYAHSEAALKRLQREACAISALNHPNICTLYDIGERDGQPFLVMEYLEGRTFSARLLAGPLKIDELLELTIQIADALEAAHSRGVVHRDIKPANLFLSSRGQAKIMDFGLAKLAAARPEDMTAAATVSDTPVTTPRSAVGTVAYMSPEQVRGEELDARTDLFSFGIVLYEMATGARPFLGTTTPTIFAAILDGTPVSPLKLRPNLPPDLERIITKALEKDRETRYQTASDIRVDLKRLKESGRSKTTAAAIARSRRPLAGIVALLLVMLLGTVAYLSMHHPPPKGAIQSLAILPFSNDSGHADAEYLSDGIAESVTNSLSRLGSAKVMSHNSVQRFKGQKIDARGAGNRLKVQAVVSGRVLQRGDNLSVSVELIDVRDNTQIWGEQYHRKMADIFAIQEDIGREIAERLRLKLTREQEKGLAKRYTANAAAYQDYLRGRYFWNKRTGADLKRAIQYFENAIAKDRAFALAYAGLADCYSVMPTYAAVSTRESWDRARAAAQSALAFDDTIAEAHRSLAMALTDWTAADREFRRALELNPGDATSHQWFAEYLMMLGRFDEAITEIRKAQEVDPLSLIVTTAAGRVYRNARRYDEAIEEDRKVLALDPNFGMAHLDLGLNYLGKSMPAEAIQELETARRLLGSSPLSLAYLGYAYATSSKATEARKLLDELREQARKGSVAPWAIATIHTGLGNKESAFKWLARAVDQGDYGAQRIAIEPIYDSLRSDPRFAELLRRMNLGGDLDRRAPESIDRRR